MNGRLISNGPESAIALAVSNKANKFFNDLMRSERFGFSKRPLEIGDILMISQNWSRPSNKLYNGDQVELKEVDWNKIVELEGFTFVPVKIKPLFSDVVIEELVLLDTILSIDGSLNWEKERKLIEGRYAKNVKLRETRNVSDDPYLGALRMMYGYSITCHKAQGGEWDNVYINTLGVKDLRWKYTAVTRGVERVVRF